MKSLSAAIVIATGVYSLIQSVVQLTALKSMSSLPFGGPYPQEGAIGGANIWVVVLFVVSLMIVFLGLTGWRASLQKDH
jgi:hypothetical protein